MVADAQAGWRRRSRRHADRAAVDVSSVCAVCAPAGGPGADRPSRPGHPGDGWSPCLRHDLVSHDVLTTSIPTPLDARLIADARPSPAPAGAGVRAAGPWLESDGERLLVRGTTYGTFAQRDGQPF